MRSGWIRWTWPARTTWSIVRRWSRSYWLRIGARNMVVSTLASTRTRVPELSSRSNRSGTDVAWAEASTDAAQSLMKSPTSSSGCRCLRSINFGRTHRWAEP